MSHTRRRVFVTWPPATLAIGLLDTSPGYLVTALFVLAGLYSLKVVLAR